MSSRYPTNLSAAVRRLLAQRMSARAAVTGIASRTRRGGRSGPPSAALRHELDSFRRAQGAAYWHHDHRSR